MSYKYDYKGKVTVVISGVGEVKEGDSIETEVEINHPDFEKTGTSKKKEPEVKEKKEK